MTIDVSSLSELGQDALPKYERLRAYLVRHLQEGKLKAGEVLPTEQKLAELAGMSRNTVRQALEQLERQGLIRRTRGRGTFIHESAMDRLKTSVDLFGLVLPETRGGFYPSLQRGFHEEASASKHQVIVTETDNDPLCQADALLQLMDKDVAGIAIVPSTNPASAAHQIRPVQERGIPVVFCHRSIPGATAPLVTFAAADVGRLAGIAMGRHGHRTIAMLSGTRAGLSPQYELGLRKGIESFEGSLPPGNVRHGNASRMTLEHEQFIERFLEELCSAADRPTAIFCTFDSDAEVAYLALARLGIRVPEDVSLVGFGGTWRGSALTRMLTSVVVEEEEVGRRAARLLHEMKLGQREIYDANEIVLPVALSDGQTLGPAPRVAAVAHASL
jgi:DNA-binding LacI/PurR family transcriptional regulator